VSTASALALCYVIFRPFIFPLISAGVIAIVCSPIHARVQRSIRKPSLSALISTALVVLIVLVPATLVVIGVRREAAALYALIDQKSSETGGLSPYLTQLLERPAQWIGQYVDISGVDLREEILGKLRDVSGLLVSKGWNIVGGLGQLLINTIVTLFTLFFLFREGRALRRRIGALLPLTREQVEKLLGGIENTIVGTVYGGLVIAAVQGTLVGLALWVLGLHSPLLWGVVASFLALLPVVGTAPVWIPAAIYLIASGSPAKGVALIAFATLVVGTIDNILRPLLLRGRVEMHTLLIFFAVFGGVSAFGFLGLFLGPVVLAVTGTLLDMLREEMRSMAPEKDLRDLPEAGDPGGGDASSKGSAQPIHST
jgi:predicted PurR-regulated permease PerM